MCLTMMLGEQLVDIMAHSQAMITQRQHDRWKQRAKESQCQQSLAWCESCPEIGNSILETVVTHYFVMWLLTVTTTCLESMVCSEHVQQLLQTNPRTNDYRTPSCALTGYVLASKQLTQSNFHCVSFQRLNSWH